MPRDVDRGRYPIRRNGEWVRPRRRSHFIACCDCGLVHRFDFRLTREGRFRVIEYRAFRDARKTAAKRRADDIVVKFK